MGELKNEKYERFARLVAEGMMKGKAYAKVYPVAGVGRANSGGPDLAGRADIADRIAELQEEAAEEMRQALRAKLKFLKEVALTRYDEVDEGSAAVRSAQRNEHGVAYTLWDRVSAVKMYSKLAGDLEPEEEVTVTPLGALIAKIRATPYVPEKREDEEENTTGPIMANGVPIGYRWVGGGNGRNAERGTRSAEVD